MRPVTIFKKLILIALLLLILPAGTHAADQSNSGKIIINVRDENNNPYVGNWFLYNGSTNKGMMVRNGSGGETFNFDPGIYFIEAQPKETIRPYRLIRSDNPQALATGETITFDIQYFQTEDQKNSPQVPVAPATTAEIAPQEPIAIAPAPENTIAPAPAPVDNSTDTSAQDPNGRTYMGPEAISEPISAPITDTTPDTASNTTKPKELAKTGSPVLLLFAFSGLLGGVVSRKKK
jgi:hypothetical protein